MGWFCQTLLFLEYDAQNSDLFKNSPLVVLIGPNEKGGVFACSFVLTKISFELPPYHLLIPTGSDPEVQLMNHFMNFYILQNFIHPCTISILKDLALEVELLVTYCRL